MNKRSQRLRRATKGRAKIRKLAVPRLTVHKTPRHIYAQIIMPDATVSVSASTVEKSIKSTLKQTGNSEAAKKIGQVIAKKALKAGITKIAFDRSGFKFHGRVKVLANAAREAGLKF